MVYYLSNDFFGDFGEKMMQIDKLVKNLIEYAMENALIEEYDRVYMTNMLGEMLGLTSYTDEAREKHNKKDRRRAVFF